MSYVQDNFFLGLKAFLLRKVIYGRLFYYYRVYYLFYIHCCQCFTTSIHHGRWLPCQYLWRLEDCEDFKRMLPSTECCLRLQQNVAFNRIQALRLPDQEFCALSPLDHGPISFEALNFSLLIYINTKCILHLPSSQIKSKWKIHNCKQVV